MMKTVLLHICCGVCASSVVEQLREGGGSTPSGRSTPSGGSTPSGRSTPKGFEVTGFFYNPNIHPQQEYEKRLEAAQNVSRTLGFELIEGNYDKDNWHKLTQHLMDEPEGGKRCELCFRIRLEETYKESRRLNIPYFTTTLSVSPHKDSLSINKIGSKLNNGFLERDFKKRDGFRRAMKFSMEHNLYRQNYCGCVYSIKTQQSGFKVIPDGRS